MGDKIYIEYLDTGKFDNLSIDLQKRIIANLTREQEIPGIIDKDRETFFAFVMSVIIITAQAMIWVYTKRL
jgi:hypothetical protein